MSASTPAFRIFPRRFQREDGGWRVEFDLRAGERNQLVNYDFPTSLGEPETDDGEPSLSQSDFTFDPDSFAVRAPMGHGSRHGGEHRKFGS